MSPALLRLLQLASPALPVGAFSYSQGLEQAVEAGKVRDEASARAWIGDLLELAFARFELPLAARLLEAWAAGDHAAIAALNARFLASRESAELRAETAQMGYSALRLLEDLAPGAEAQRALLAQLPELAWPTGWTCAAHAFGIEHEAALAGYAWAWLENQALAVVKLVPLGQSAGQRMLLALGTALPACVERAGALAEDDWSNFAPGLALASALHETQYSRLFRS